MIKHIKKTGLLALFLLLFSAVSAQGKFSISEWAELNKKVNELYNCGDYDNAMTNARKSLDMIANSIGMDHPGAGISLSNIAMIYCAKGQYAEAEQLYKQALDIYEKAGPNYNMYVSGGLSNIAILYCIQVRYAEAEPLFTRALAINEESGIPGHHDETAVLMISFALLYDCQNRHADAEHLFKRAVALIEPNHPDLSRKLASIADLFRKSGWKNGANELEQRAAFIRGTK